MTITSLKKVSYINETSLNLIALSVYKIDFASFYYMSEVISDEFLFFQNAHYCLLFIRLFYFVICDMCFSISQKLFKYQINGHVEMVPRIAMSILFFILHCKMFSWCRSKIRLHIMCSLILIFTYKSCIWHLKGYINWDIYGILN